jgi:DNA-binding NtrC family response regulator
LAFRRAFNLSEYTGITMADAAVAAFQELGEHLAIMEGGRLVSSRGLNETKQSLEHDAIRLALENANGSVTHAARSLGISFQALTYMLETRHKDLLKQRTPARRRPRR